jgi:alkylation response protein AidB-like acyl-CoA dehydrogenase
VSFELLPRTASGAAVVGAAESLVVPFAERAQAADARNEMCRENFDELFTTGISSAFVPEALGGFGLESIHDWILVIATLARGDASTAIAITMHHAIGRRMAQTYALAITDLGPEHERTKELAKPLRSMAAGEMLVCATATEVGTDNLHPAAEAVPHRSGDSEGWRVNGHKIFVTMSPIATHVSTVVRVRDDDGDHMANIVLPMDTPGLLPQGDWDALGMRGSGSQSVVFEDMWVPDSALSRIGPWGRWSLNYLQFRAIANIVLVGAFLGIAEAAHDIALTKLATRTRVGQLAAEQSGIQNLVGEMTIELAQCRAVLGSAGVQMDEYSERHASSAASMEDAHGLMRDYQVAKWTVNRGAIGVVSKAMDLLGGSGYTNSAALARLYRDVRAGPFMQPFGPAEMREYVGQVTLGQYPEK